MANSHFAEEFKIEAVKQITERGYSVAEVSERLGVSTYSLYAWKKRYDRPRAEAKASDVQAAEIRRLKQELARATEERDILKTATADFAKNCLPAPRA